MEIRAASRCETSGTFRAREDVAWAGDGDEVLDLVDLGACPSPAGVAVPASRRTAGTRHEPTTSTGLALANSRRPCPGRDRGRRITLCLSRGLRGRRRQ